MKYDISGNTEYVMAVFQSRDASRLTSYIIKFRYTYKSTVLKCEIISKTR